MNNTSVKISNYKCFKEASGLDEITRVNLIIGRNNSGKSAVLDLVENVCRTNYEYQHDTWHKGSAPKVSFSSTIDEDTVNRVFPANVSEGKIRGQHRVYGQKFIGRSITWCKSKSGSLVTYCDEEEIFPKLTTVPNYLKALGDNMPIPLQGANFLRLRAERDIQPEPAGQKPEIRDNGLGFTRTIECFLSRSDLPSQLVEDTMLAALNIIFAHDASFTKILCQRHSDDNWEIYLEEEEKGRIALSKSGSGLKTVMLVLAYIILIPEIEKKSLNLYAFGFEELENNIHPALLRRLNEYIYQMSVEHDFTYFLTTHSNVLIDQFSRQEDAQIVHVSQSNGVSTCSTAKTYIENNGIFDDLDVRASDILQSNGIIWVEGPSDRVYLNRWIEIWSDGELKEGTHYQIVFYGGRLLSHLDAEDPDSDSETISILRANRNSILVIDSDKRNRQTPINCTKTRILSEIEYSNGYGWITKGREIENYIPIEATEKLLGISAPAEMEQYDSYFDYIDDLSSHTGSKFQTNKMLLAGRVVPYLSKDNLSKHLDLAIRLGKVCEKIRSWNS